MKFKKILMVLGFIVASQHLSANVMTNKVFNDYSSGLINLLETAEKNFGEREAGETIDAYFASLGEKVETKWQPKENDLSQAINKLKLTEDFENLDKASETEIENVMSAIETKIKAIKSDDTNKDDLELVASYLSDNKNLIKFSKDAGKLVKKYYKTPFSNGKVDSFIVFTESLEEILNGYDDLDNLEEALNDAKTDEVAKKTLDNFLTSLDSSIAEFELAVKNNEKDKYLEKLGNKMNKKTDEAEIFKALAKDYTTLTLAGKPQDITAERVFENRLDINENKMRINHLENRVNDLENKMDRGISQVAAMTVFDSGLLAAGEYGIGAGVATHNSTQSVAVGAAYAVTDNLKLTTKIAATPGKGKGSYTAAVGAFYKFSR